MDLILLFSNPFAHIDDRASSYLLRVSKVAPTISTTEEIQYPTCSLPLSSRNRMMPHRPAMHRPDCSQ